MTEIFVSDMTASLRGKSRAQHDDTKRKQQKTFPHIAIYRDTHRWESAYLDRTDRIFTQIMMSRSAAADAEAANVGDEAAARPAEPPGQDLEGFEVEMIVGDRIWRGKRQFLLKWKNYDSADNTWENEEDLHCEHLLADYVSRKSAESGEEAAPKPPRRKRAKEKAPKEGAPPRTTRRGRPPKEKAPKEKAPKERAPKERAPKEKAPEEEDRGDDRARAKPRAKSKAAGNRRRQSPDDGRPKVVWIQFPDVTIPTGNRQIEILGARLHAGIWYYSVKVEGESPIDESSDFVRVCYPTVLASFLQNTFNERPDE
jgi:hypothetical protein